MRRSHRLIAAAVLIALSGALAGCTGGMSSFDPSDMLDWLDTKKKLPGERKPVFPEGVPGLEQGVPKNLYRGSAQEQIDQQNAQAAAAAAAAPSVEEPKSKPGAKSKGKSKQAATAATAPAEEPAAALPHQRLISQRPRLQRNRRSPRNNPRRHRSRHRCQAAASRANFKSSFH